MPRAYVCARKTAGLPDRICRIESPRARVCARRVLVLGAGSRARKYLRVGCFIFDGERLFTTEKTGGGSYTIINIYNYVSANPSLLAPSIRVTLHSTHLNLFFVIM
jgi:hypothetical protein